MKSFENIEGKGENAGIQHFLLVPQCFLATPKHISVFHSVMFILSSESAFDSDWSKILSLCDKDLNTVETKSTDPALSNEPCNMYCFPIMFSTLSKPNLGSCMPQW